MPQGHPLREKSVIHVNDLRDVPLVLLGRQRNLRTALDQVFRQVVILPNVRMGVHSVSDGGGVPIPPGFDCQGLVLAHCEVFQLNKWQWARSVFAGD